MRIGIDIDGVLTNVIRYACDYGSKYFFEKYGELDININAWSLKDMFGVSDEEDKECWLSLVKNYSINEPARPFAAEIIKKMREENNEIYIITARSASKWDDEDGEMNHILTQWLKNNHIQYDKLIISNDKLEMCKKYHINIMVEDKTENINSISTELPVICFHENHNKNLNGKNIYRAYSWYDVYYKYLLIKEDVYHEKN
ncbi:TPA: hypothetical protein IAB95_03955 [Candidatus Ventrenecus avicola]|nr:hypothetical protein [Candidatus Ventrenecus avicola]